MCYLSLVPVVNGCIGNGKRNLLFLAVVSYVNCLAFKIFLFSGNANKISFYYEGWAVDECPGHWEWRSADQLEWVEGSMPPEDAILEDLLACVRLACKNVTGAILEHEY